MTTNLLALSQRKALPDALRVLVDDYPRAQWEGHENFGELVRFWMQRHVMFRQLVQVLREDTQGLVQQETSFEDYAPRLSHYGGTLLNELHNHHQIEDHHYFPKLVKLDARLERGFDLLETDHEAIDGILHGMAEAANAVLARGEPNVFLDRLEGFSMLLERHLEDEEELIVPVILKTGFTG